MVDEVEWVTSKQVRDLIGKHRKDLASTIEARLRPSLQFGRLICKAAMVNAESKGPLGKKIQIQDYVIPAKAWEGKHDRSSFSLSGDCYTTSDGDGVYGRIDANGLTFNKAQLLAILEIDPDSPPPQTISPPLPVLTTKTNAGARVDAAQWAEFAAALAHIANINEIKDSQSDSSVYDLVSDFLASRGRGVMGIDTARPAIRMAKAWLHGHPFKGDFDYKGDHE